MRLSLTQRRLIYGAIVLLAIGTGIGLRRGAFWEGFGSDDYLHFAMLEGVYPAKRSPFDLFSFYKTHQEVKDFKQFGTLPWLTDPNFRLAMLRPLSSALTTFDYLVFGNHVYAFYLHSVFWWVLMVIAVALVLAEVLPIPLAAVAVLLFAIDESNDSTFCWLANRNGVVSLGLGALGLWAHIRWQRSGYKRYFLLSVASIVLALLGGEWVFGIFAYIFAFELFAEQKPTRQRAIALLPTAILGGSFVLVQSILQYGALHSSVYVSPFTDPLLFLFKAIERVPVYFADMVLGIPTVWWYIDSPWRQDILSLGIFSRSTWEMMPVWRYWHFALGLVAIGVFVPLARWAIRAFDADVRRALRWLIVGALFALVPMIASVQNERLTLPAEIGLSALFSAILVAAAQRVYWGVKRNPMRPPLVTAILLLGASWIHIYHAASRSASETQSIRYVFESTARWIAQADIDDAKVAQQQIVLINPVDHTTAVFLPFIRYAFGHPMPRSCWTLSAAPFAHAIKRTAASALEFTVLGAFWERDIGANFYLDARRPLKRGDTFAIEGLKVEILTVTRGFLHRFRFTFAKPLDDPGYLFLISSKKGLRRLKLPAVGKTIRIRPGQFPDQALLPKATLRVREPIRARERFRTWAY